VEVDPREDSMPGEDPLGRAEPLDVDLVVAAGLRLDGLLDRAEADRVEAVAPQEGRIVGPEPTAEGWYGGRL
jgi:hypothetical protein